MSRGGYGKLKLNSKYVYPYPYYPVGAVVIFGNNTNPNDIYIGKWVQLKDVFILACGDKYKCGDTGGEETHTLTVNEMPAHNHYMQLPTGTYAGSYNNVCKTGNYVDNWNMQSNMSTAGGSGPHNNMPPYVAKYCWERVA